MAIYLPFRGRDRDWASNDRYDYLSLRSWLRGWTYRKSVTLSRASGAVSNYQMKLLVGKSSSATGEDVDCGDHVAADFDDLRFTTSDGTTLLDYWIESISGSGSSALATVWIEFNTIGTGATTFYMYYGGTETAVSNVVDTFIQGDDFEWGANGTGLDTSGGGITWTEVVDGPIISTERCYGGSRSMKIPYSASYAQAQFTLAPSAEISLMFRFCKENAAALYAYHGNGTKRVYLQIDATEDLFYYAGGTKTDTGSNVSADNWQSLEINNFNWTSYTFDLWFNGSKILTGAAMNTSANANGVVWFIGDGTTSGADSFYDNVIVRNWRATGPAWGAWGAEES